MVTYLQLRDQLNSIKNDRLLFNVCFEGLDGLCISPVELRVAEKTHSVFEEGSPILCEVESPENLEQ